MGPEVSKTSKEYSKYPGNVGWVAPVLSHVEISPKLQDPVCVHTQQPWLNKLLLMRLFLKAFVMVLVPRLPYGKCLVAGLAPRFVS